MTKVFNKRNAKRVTAILLAVVAVVSSIFIIPTASAAGKEVTVTFDYCYDTGGNIISFVKYTEHGGYTVGTVGEELCRIYADGKDAYCIEPGHSLYSGNTLTTDASAAWNALSKTQKKAVNLALLFGKSGSSSSLVGTDGHKRIATQLVVWEFCTGCRDASTFKLSNSKFIDGITAGDHNPNVKTNYNKIIAKLNSYNVIPSFSYDTQASVYKGYKQDKIEMRGDRAEMSDFPLYLNTVAGGLDRRDQTIGGFSFVVKIYALPVVEIIGQLLYLLGRYGFNAQFGDCL